jgi:hypothetical protein
MPLSTWILMLVACGGQATVGDGGGGADAPAPYVVDEPQPPQASADVDEVQAALQRVVDAVLTVSAHPVQDAYSAVMSDQGGGCPNYYDSPDGTYWFDQCTSDSGADFSGYVFAYGAYQVIDPYSGMPMDYWQGYGGATVTTGGGERFELAGTAVWTSVLSPEGDAYQSLVQGTFAWDGPEADDTWLGDASIDPDLYWYAAAFPAVGGNYLYVDGALGLGDEAAAFDGVQIGENIGFACGVEPGGTIGVRVADGSWYDVQFHGPTDADPEVAPKDCDGCGDAFYRGEPLGTVCVDFSAWTGWGDAPW